MPGRLNILLIFFIIVIFARSILAQSDKHLDSLENAIKHSEATEKADLMIESIGYQWGNLRTLEKVPFVDATRLAYQYSKKIQYKKGRAKSAKLLIHAFTEINERDSVRYYLAESLKLYIELKDSINIASLYYLYSSSERGDGNYSRALNYADKIKEIAAVMNSASLMIGAYGSYCSIYKLTGEFSKEEESYQKMLELYIETHQNPSRILIDLARYHISHGNYKEGISYSKMADAEIGKLEDISILEYHDKAFMQAKMKGNVARAYRLWGYFDSALVWHRRAIAGMESASFHSNVDIPNQWEGIGAVFTQQGMYDSARYYLEKSANSREEVSDFLGAGESFDGLGYMCWLLGDQEGAVNYYRKAIEMKSKVGLIKATWRMTTFKESQSVTYLRLGQAYASWGMTESALREFDKSLVLCREIGYRRGEAEVLIEFGKQRKNNLQAEKDLKDALRIFTEIDYKPGQADAISSIGDLFYSKGEYEKSLEYYKQSESILLNTENPILLADAWMKIGLVLSGLKRYDQAAKYLVSALDQAKKYNLFQQIMKSEKALSDLYRLTGKDALAMVNFQSYLVIRDSVNRQKTYYLLADLQSNYKAEMNQRQIELLEKEERVKTLTLSRSNALLTGTFGLILLLVLLSVSILRTLKLKEAQREALLQQRLFRSRLSPGFIDYSLGNVKRLVRESNITGASDYITYFSRMMQQMLEGSRRELIVFSKGLSMLKSFFELNKLSQEGSFDYEINVDPQIDQEETTVPSFLEEVITPGYKAETGQRFVRVIFTGKERKIGISVESRGSVSSLPGLSDQDLKSLMIIRNRLSEMEKKYKVSLDYIISDLYDHDGNLEGKKLEFDVPALFD
jgi:tetratricopeptide (TPR) repeat protein